MSKTEFLSAELRQTFVQLIAQQTGLEMRQRDQSALNEKIYLRMKALKIDLPETYYQLLKNQTRDSHKEWQNLVEDLTNNESYFFRDQEQFNLLRNHILPELITRNENNKTLRICSAGCSSGEEPYSLAILLTELIPNLEQWNLIIFGIDINQVALQKAKTGIYSPWSFRRVDEEIKRRYFRLSNNQYYINQKIKQMISFLTLNLVNDQFPLPNSELRELDLIICRNVFIYFEAPAIAKVLDKFYQALQPFGYLITGHTELYNQNLSNFQTKVFPESLIYQRQADNLVDTPLVFSPSESTYSPGENLFFKADDSDIEIALKKSNIQMQQTALGFLKQLPPNTKLPKLKNLTVAELILRLETALKAIDRETK